MRKIDLIGHRFGRLLAQSESTDKIKLKTKRKRIRWLCLCDCGNSVIVLGENLRYGQTKSCGCFNLDQLKKGKHGHAKNGILTPEYRSWRTMKSRCRDYNNKYYGGRGIAVCKRWQNSFENFYNDMGPRLPNTTLERRNNNKGYTPSNCYWASYSIQSYNRRIRSDNTSGYKGIFFNRENKRWRAMIGFNKTKKFLGDFSTIDDAIGTRRKAELDVRKQLTINQVLGGMARQQGA